jgi:hypothetical protein
MTKGQGQMIHQRLVEASAFDAWEPRDGHAIVTCKIKVHIGKWEPRTYEFLRTREGWTIDTHPGHLSRNNWQGVVDWFCRMQPIDIDLLTTV